VAKVVLGPRRVVEQIRIEPSGRDETCAFPVKRTGKASRQEVLEVLLASGYLAFIRQRPFSRIADPEVEPKSIFVNAMRTAPYGTDAAVAVAGEGEAFQAGLDALRVLTPGPVFLVLPASGSGAPHEFADARGVEKRTIRGPHPAGNTGVHIHHLHPLSPGQTVWTIRAEDVALVGRLWLDGVLPTARVVAVAGPGVKEHARRHVRARIGGSVGAWLPDLLGDGEQRVLNGDILSGRRISPDGFLPFHAHGFTVIPEDRERHLLGWLAPGRRRFSLHRTYASGWETHGPPRTLGTNRNGSPRAMVLTGLYDRYLPMRVMLDPLVRAVLAGDTDEAIRLGLLELDPEDVALCAFACPSKMDLVGVIRQGLDAVEAEGL
jgi:Na+-transporting NADH:ubiquinone oxidoreductase subunit A